MAVVVNKKFEYYSGFETGGEVRTKYDIKTDITTKSTVKSTVLEIGRYFPTCLPWYRAHYIRLNGQRWNETIRNNTTSLQTLPKTIKLHIFMNRLFKYSLSVEVAYNFNPNLEIRPLDRSFRKTYVKKLTKKVLSLVRRPLETKFYIDRHSFEILFWAVDISKKDIYVYKLCCDH